MSKSMGRRTPDLGLSESQKPMPDCGVAGYASRHVHLHLIHLLVLIPESRVPSPVFSRFSLATR